MTYTPVAKEVFRAPPPPSNETHIESKPIPWRVQKWLLTNKKLIPKPQKWVIFKTGKHPPLNPLDCINS